MTDHQINFLGWVLFVISSIGFCIASIGHFWAMFGSAFFLVACLVFMLPFFRPLR
ncbi:cytochrome oxidase subunit III [Roseovarius sp. D0-M9]|uniref:cytochrome oxidase subunit III n=1 Tax=Roseovarius sp. D0-M9 TaxID=3127117 RepID=UPI00300FDFA7